MTAAEMVAEALAHVNTTTPETMASFPGYPVLRRTLASHGVTHVRGDVFDAALAHPAERASRAEERAARAEADLRRMETRALTDALDALREATRG